MRNFYNTTKSFKLFLLVAALFLSTGSRVAAQCSFAIPSDALVITQDTTITELPYVYTWVCAGVHLLVQCACGGGGPNQPYGSFFLEDGASMINSPNGGGSWNIYMKSNATLSNGTNPNYCGGSWLVYGDSTDTFLNNACGLDISYCHPTFDYTNAPAGGCAPVVPPPVAQFSANPLNVCAGSPVTFTDSSTGSPLSWKWTFAGGTPDTSSLQNPTVSYDTAGVFNVTLIAGNASGADTLIKTGYVTVTALPVVGNLSANPNTLCAGDSSYISISGSTGSIQWQSSGTPGNYQNIANADSAVYNTQALSQNTYYRAVLANGICSDTSSSLMLTVHPLPSPPALSTPDSLICTSDSTTITATVGYASYRWNNGDTINYITVNSGGGYWVTVSDTNGCSTVSGHLEISVYPVPSASIVQQGDTLSSYGQVGYHWLLNGTPIDSATGAVYVAKEQGSYSVQVTDSNGCSAISNAVTITGITDLTDESISIYPNPSVGSWQLAVGNDLVGSELSVFDEQGQIVFQSTIRNPKSEIDLNVAKGVYYLCISNANTSLIRKLVKL